MNAARRIYSRTAFRSLHACALIAAVVGGLAAVGCAGARSSDTGARLVELQTGLPAGNAPAWYTQKLDELGYDVTSLRYERSDLLAYGVEKDGTAFRIQIALDAEQGTARQIEIEPLGAVAAAPPGQQPSAGPGAADAADSAGGATPSNAPAAEQAPAPRQTERPAVAEPSAPSAPAERPTAPEAETPAAPEPRPSERPSARAPMSPPAPEPAVRIVALPAGTRIPTRLNDMLDSGKSQANDSFSMTVSEPVYLAGIEAIPAGSRIWGYVADVESARRPNRGGRLVLKAGTLEAHGSSFDFEALVTAEGQPLEGEESIREDLKEIAVGAGVGGLIGGLIGGGKGVLAGVLIGGGGTFAATRGEQVELPPDTPLFVELRQELSISVPR